MSDLTQIIKANELAATKKYQTRARAMNNPGGHAKSAEKGCKQTFPAARLKAVPVGACRGLDNLR